MMNKIQCRWCGTTEGEFLLMLADDYVCQKCWDETYPELARQENTSTLQARIRQLEEQLAAALPAVQAIRQIEEMGGVDVFRASEENWCASNRKSDEYEPTLIAAIAALYAEVKP